MHVEVNKTVRAIHRSNKSNTFLIYIIFMWLVSLLNLSFIFVFVWYDHIELLWNWSICLYSQIHCIFIFKDKETENVFKHTHFLYITTNNRYVNRLDNGKYLSYFPYTGCGYSEGALLHLTHSSIFPLCLLRIYIFITSFFFPALYAL